MLSKQGITLIEILVVVAIIAILVSLSFSSYVDLNKSQSVDKDAMLALSVLSEARSLTLASKNGTQYGVHFSTSQITLFTGATYIDGALTNQVNTLSSYDQISTINLAGGGSDVVFDRLTGATSQNGTVTISAITNPSLAKTITIFSTGTSQMN